MVIARNRSVVVRAAAYFALGFILLALALFIPAGTLNYWEAWLYLAVLFGPVLVFGAYLARNEPELLERRLRTRETELRQRWIIRLALVGFVVAVLLPGFDHRFGWSDIPTWVVLLADLMILVGYGLFVYVLLSNHYASRVVEVEAGQPVITTGPYAVVRHPMYVAVLVMWLLMPVALGSWWAVLPMLVIIPVLVLRIQNEEEVLLRELPGYREYTAQVRYRLLPGLW